jgi:hypothetical protein
VPLDLPASTVYPRSLSRAPVNEARTEFGRFVTTWDHNSREMSTFGRCLETSSSAGAGLDGLELAAGLLFRVEEVVSNK